MNSLREIAEKLRPHFTKQNSVYWIVVIGVLVVFYKFVLGLLVLSVIGMVLVLLFSFGGSFFRFAFDYVSNLIDAVRGYPKARARAERMHKLMANVDAAIKKEKSQEP